MNDGSTVLSHCQVAFPRHESDHVLYELQTTASIWFSRCLVVQEEDRVVIVRFGNDADPICMQMDEVLASVADPIKNFAVIYLVDITAVSSSPRSQHPSWCPHRHSRLSNTPVHTPFQSQQQLCDI